MSSFFSFSFFFLLLYFVTRYGNGDQKREESRTKDRVISHLESELRVQTGRAQQFRDILEQSLLTASRGGVAVSFNSISPNHRLAFTTCLMELA